MCLTDNVRPEPLDIHGTKYQTYMGVECINISKYNLHGWWAKMCLFNRAIVPEGRILYFDLDTVIINDLTPLAEWSGGFGICANFTRAAGHKTWPCKYGSCVMSIGPQFGQQIWDEFTGNRHRLIKECPHGDQQAIEQIHPFAGILQVHVPPGFFLGYRDLTEIEPFEDGVVLLAGKPSVVVFGGNNKPENCKIPWVQEAWQ